MLRYARHKIRLNEEPVPGWVSRSRPQETLHACGGVDAKGVKHRVCETGRIYHHDARGTLHLGFYQPDEREAHTLTPTNGVCGERSAAALWHTPKAWYNLGYNERGRGVPAQTQNTTNEP